MYKKILVCLDGSHLSEQILPHATEVARCCGSRIVLLEVTVQPSALVEPLTGYFHATPLDKILREEKEARTYLNRLARRLRKFGVKVSSSPSVFQVIVPGTATFEPSSTMKAASVES